MVEFRGTPGPWRAWHNGHYWQIDTDHPDWAGNTIGDACASQFMHHRDGSEAKEVHDAANARLIAAAPELLSALELLCDELGMSMPDNPQELFNAENIWRAFAQAKTAIARATRSAG